MKNPIHQASTQASTQISTQSDIPCTLVSLSSRSRFFDLSTFVYLMILSILSLSFVACQQEPWIQIQSHTTSSQPLPSQTSSKKIENQSKKQKSEQEGKQIKDIIHAPQSLSRSAQSLKDSLPVIRTSIEKQLALTIPSVEIYLSHSESQMQDQAQKQEGYRPPEWAHGLAYAHSRHIYLHAMSHQELQRVCMHEMIHIALGQKQRIPRWVNEGVAIIVSEGISWQRMLHMQQTSLVGRFLSFEQITRTFPRSSTQAQLAYAQSTHMLSWLRDRYGMPSLQKWIHALMEGSTIPQATLKHFAKPWRMIENDWIKTHSYHPLNLISFLLQETTLFFIAILIFLIGGRRVLKRRKEQRALLDHNETEIHVLEGNYHVNQVPSFPFLSQVDPTHTMTENRINQAKNPSE